ncbi:iron-sulfur cluster carrier protein ApbC [Thiomicrospira sp. ALE5]|uniref:iron-sulfur cluster carrier protein ApbC n=1 Tax=Thiomicrospira sp. ALE5 TaxID=748650 RepID=UPI0008E190A3|nr:iron-sulfur cluster carrier protein ApbC [Thiomicrospira sp. ALE5]SFR58620.1 ATP-binding protein involved in chromosome partitioning [Thiomicrospira sp. ALE5]
MGLISKLLGNNAAPSLDDEQRVLFEQHIGQLTFPLTEQSLNKSNAIKNIAFKDGRLSFDLIWPFAAKTLHNQLNKTIEQAASQIPGVTQLSIQPITRIQAYQTQPSVAALPGIKNIIAVASGKGGVGKSTTSVNLALALQNQGANVGILDADIYGPSIPTLLKLTGKPQTSDGKSMEPMQAYGLQAMSIGCLIEEDTPMIWRGPIVTQTLTQLLKETRWQALDFLIIDLPPGTGDVQLTLAQQIPVTGAIIVTTPQDLALIDAKKAVKMFEKVNIPVLGLVENMSTHICSNCGHEEAIFGHDGGVKLAKEYKIDVLGQLPLNIDIRLQADSGCPTVAHDPAQDLAQRYIKIAHKLGAQLLQHRKNYSHAFPNIVVQNS